MIQRTLKEKHIIFAIGLFVFFIGLLVLSIPAAHSRPGPQWVDVPANVRAWYQSLMRPDAPTRSCCGEADAFEVDTFEVESDHYVAVITDGKGVLANGTRIPVPNEKMKWDAGNPTGHGVIFIGTGGNVLCYVAPSGA